MQAPLNPPLDTPSPADPVTASRIRIVLVGTQHPGNIGSAARAIKTMGLHRLVLVAPQKFPHNEADMMAAGADDVLASALEVETLADAVSDCRLVLGCTARSRRVQLRELDPRMAAASVRADAEAGGEVEDDAAAFAAGGPSAGLDASDGLRGLSGPDGEFGLAETLSRPVPGEAGAVPSGGRIVRGMVRFGPAG